MSEKYALESILKMRQDVEERRLHSMTQSLDYYQKNIDLEKALEEEIAMQMRLVETLADGDLVSQRSRYLYLESMRQKLEEQRRNVKMAKVVYENKKSEFIAAQRDRKVIEKHKSGYLQKLRQELSRLEANQNNELAIATFNRGRSYR